MMTNSKQVGLVDLISLLAEDGIGFIPSSKLLYAARGNVTELQFKIVFVPFFEHLVIVLVIVISGHQQCIAIH